MFTEDWPVDHDPDWPKRSSAVGAGAPRIYLDMWCFTALARDRAGKLPANDDAVGLYERLRSYAVDEKAVFLLSRSHYTENWQRSNVDGRWDTAVVMGELTGFNTICAELLDVWEATHGLSTVFSDPSDLPWPDPVGWGVGYCYTRRQLAARLLLNVNGKRLDWSEKGLSALSQMERRLSYRAELAMLARWDPNLAAMMDSWPLEQAEIDQFSKKFAVQELEYQRLFADNDLDGEKLEVTIGLMVAHASRQVLQYAGQLLKLPETFQLGLSDQALAVVEDGGRWTETHLAQLLDAMPILSVYSSLRKAAFSIPNWKHEPGDFHDFWAIATTAPFVDVVVCDRRTLGLAKACRIEERETNRAVFFRKLSDVCAHVERTAGPL